MNAGTDWVTPLSNLNTLVVLDRTTGKVAYEKKMDQFKGQAYSSPTLAGKYILISSEKGLTVVIEPGTEYKEVARNTLEPFRSTPVFSGTRMLIRAERNLYCIGK